MSKTVQAWPSPEVIMGADVRSKTPRPPVLGALLPPPILDPWRLPGSKNQVPGPNQVVYHGLSSFSPLKLPKLEVLILGSWRNPVHVAVLWCSLYLYPHLEVPPNHPRLDFFDIKTYGFGGTPILRNLHFIISFWSIPESAESRFRGGCSFLRSSSARAFSSASFCWAKRFFPSRALRRADDMGTWASTRKWKMWRESIIIGCNWWN